MKRKNTAKKTSAKTNKKASSASANASRFIHEQIVVVEKLLADAEAHVDFKAAKAKSNKILKSVKAAVKKLTGKTLGTKKRASKK